MSAVVYTQAEVDQKVADALATAKAADITPAQVQAAAVAAAAQAVATMPAPSAGLTATQVQALIDASLAKAVAVGTTRPANPVQGTVFFRVKA